MSTEETLKSLLGRARWYTSVILTLWKRRQEDTKFKASLGYVARPFSQEKNPPKELLHN
jgi:hypothetical protein